MSSIRPDTTTRSHEDVERRPPSTTSNRPRTPIPISTPRPHEVVAVPEKATLTLLPRYGLLLIDIQRAFNHPSYFGPGTRSTPAFEANLASLLATFRDVVAPADIFHVCHHSKLPNSPLNRLWDDSVGSGSYSDSSSSDGGGGGGRGGRGEGVGSGVAFMPCALPLPSEPTFAKSVNSAFIGTDLESAIRRRGITVLVIAGLTTDHCVSTTGAGQKIMLVSDATATWARRLGDRRWDAETVHPVQLASLGGEFCEVVTTAQVLMGLGVDCWRGNSAVTPDEEGAGREFVVERG